MMYNNPKAGQNSSIGNQLLTEYYQKQALIEARKQQFFSQLADVTTMPKNYGKEIKKYHYMPLLDDRNINSEGIDASGAKISNGNLYGSSKDIGTITGKLPTLSETGGRVNRVGFSRRDLKSNLEKFGFFTEYTQESLDFDTDSELLSHINRELINGANEITEDLLQIDLINHAGVIFYAGSATSTNTVSSNDIVTYKDLMRLSITLDNNRCPKQTTVITGTRNIDTRVINGGRVMYIGSELIPTLRSMKDLHGEPAFVSIEKYAAGTTTLTGEIGTIDQFRIIVVPEMLKWEGAGAAASGSNNYATNGKIDVFPMLVIGDQSFTTIGFQTDGKSVKFTTYHIKPGEQAVDRFDPFGENGVMSIKWYYGFMCLRPERLALIKTSAIM